MVEVGFTRHPFGLPAGSVRATLALAIAGLFWTLLLLPDEKQIPIPLFLYFLMAMILLFFFSHGKSIGAGDGRSPWGLPRGTFRFLLVAGTAAVFGLFYYLHQELPLAKLVPKPEQLTQWPNLLIALAGGLGLGWLVGRGPWRTSYVFQDIQAWVSLLAMLGLTAEILIVLFINPNLKKELKLDLSLWECILTGIVAWYFGARS
jgi:hypothetical protein